MFNQHLLQLNLSVPEYRALGSRMGRHFESYYAGLPDYLIARCPLCGAENIEKLDTYSLREWPGMNVLHGASIFGYHAVVRHCEHLALVHRFINLNGAQSSAFMGIMGPEVPHVIGYLLKPQPFSVPHAIDAILQAKKFYSQAVIHALPVCRIEDDRFHPMYTVYILTYFSESPSDTRKVVQSFNAFFGDPRDVPMFWEPPDGRAAWWDLEPWVADNQLHWIDGNSPDLKLRSGTRGFLYGHIEGRRYPYFIKPHLLDDWKEPPHITTTHPDIDMFAWQLDPERAAGKVLAGLHIRWKGLRGSPAFSLIRHPVAQYWLPEPNTHHRVRAVNILVHDIQQFALRSYGDKRHTEVLIKVKYEPGERTLGLTDRADEARQWIEDANQFLKAVQSMSRNDFLRLSRSET